MGRPVGVTVIAILDFLGAALCILGGVLIMVGGGLAASFLGQGQGGAAGAGFAAAFGAVLGVFFIAIALLVAFVGWGLWKLKGWARIVAIVLAAIGAVLQLFGLLSIFAHFNIVSFIWTLCVLAYNVWVIWYLLKADVKAAFAGAVARAATA
jgi:hypothetical protein